MKYVRLYACVSVCMWENWDIDIKIFTVSQLNQTILGVIYLCNVIMYTQYVLNGKPSTF